MSRIPQHVRAGDGLARRDDGLAWISWLRVLAITGVVLIHVAGLNAITPGARGTTLGRLGIVLDFGSRWAVPVFIMLSGALLLDPARYRGPRDFLARRAVRLLPAIIVWHLVYLAWRASVSTRPISPGAALRLVLNGQVWTALYFFWIVLGLAVITPVLIPWVAQATRSAVLLAGVAAAAVPVLTLLTVPVRGVPLVWVHTPWTWWIPYLGYYLLGYALRDVVLRRARLAAVAGVVVTGIAVLAWQWRRPTGLGQTLERYQPAESYYSVSVLAVAVGVFLLGRSLVRPGGGLRALCRPKVAVVGRRLGDATLGVFASHLLVLEVVMRLPVVGGPAATSVPALFARILLVLLGAYLIALVGRQVPLVRRVL